MNWNKAKTIMIVFFICTNLFLLTIIIVSTGRTSIVTDDIVTSTISVLKNNRIEIDPAIIPRRTQPVEMIEAKNFIDSYENFSKKFAGSNAVLTENNKYVGELGMLSYSGDKFEFLPSQPMYGELTDKINLENARQISLEILKKYGFDDNNLIINTEVTAGRYVVTLTKQANGLYYFNSQINVELSKKGLEKINGSWFYDKYTRKEKFTLKSVASILIDYISLANRPTASEKIVALNLGYSVLEEGIYHKEILLTPCWKIVLEQGNECILSAIENQTV